MLSPLSKNHYSDLKKLLQKKYRQEQSITLVEGINTLRQLIDNGLYPQEIVFCGDLPDFLHGLKAPLWEASEGQIAGLSETRSNVGLIAVYSAELPQWQQGRFTLYLDGINDPGNLGTIFRTAAAFGVESIVLSEDCADSMHPKVIRASLGSVMWLPHRRDEGNWLAEAKGVRIGLLGDGDSLLREVKLSKEQAESIILVIGSEAHGISRGLRQHLDIRARIAITPRMESLNAAIAAGIGCYEVAQRLFLLT